MAGSIVNSIALVFSIFAMILYYLSYRGYKNTINYARLAYHAMTMLVIVSSTLLLYFILTHQFQYDYVYNYSNQDLPVGYLIATFWAGQEGSFMLWLFMAAIIGVFLQNYSEKRDDLEPRVMAVYSLVTSFLLLMVSPLMKNPFALLWHHDTFIEVKNVAQMYQSLPFLGNYIYGEGQGPFYVKVSSDFVANLNLAGVELNQFIMKGKGLNPLLQNFWMQIHPPILFAGFSLAAVPFTFALAALMKNDYKDWIRQSFPWLLACAGVLGLGIMMGGYWAYGVLGWGGYWAWDPVENSSLVPWIVAVAAIHTMLVQKRSQKKGSGPGKFARTNLILSILTFVLVLYSTFLTRSGILGDASVHSFASPGYLVYYSLLAGVLIFLGTGVGMILWRWKYLTEQANINDEGLMSREQSLFTSAVILGASALIVLVGTSAPIFGRSVDISFYDQMHIPLGIIIGILNGLSLKLKWKNTRREDILKGIAIPAGITAVVVISAVLFAGVDKIMMILLLTGAVFSLVVNTEIMIKIMRGGKQMVGAYVAHIGLALFIVGVIGSAAFSKETQVDLVKGQVSEVLGQKVVFRGLEQFYDFGTKYYANIEMITQDDRMAKPVMYIAEFNQGLMREPDILNGWVSDFYITPLSFDDGSQQSGTGSVHDMVPGGTTEAEGTTIKYKDFIAPDMAAMSAGTAFRMGIIVDVTKDGKTVTKEVTFSGGGGGQPVYETVSVPEFGIKMQIAGLEPGSRKAKLSIAPEGGNLTPAKKQEVLTIQASIKPLVNFVWAGVIIMTLGFFLSTSRRLKESYAQRKAAAAQQD